MRGLRTGILVVLALLLGLGAKAQVLIKPGVPLIVPGTGLGWEEDELRLVVQVEQAGEVEINLYSPGFDPDDYRSPNELGDERYDGGKGRVEALYRLLYRDEVLAEKRFGVEKHRWVTFYRGRLGPGEYVLSSRFFGNGKNAVIFEVKALSGKAFLAAAPSSMQTYNVVRGGWQTPFILNIPIDSPGVRAGIYDGDGPRELQMRVETPDGVIYPPVPGNRAWTYINTEKKGRYAFSFRIPKTATQHTNTVGFRLFLGDIRVEVVDEAGRPVPGAGYRVLGEYVREVIPLIPDGWKLVRSEVENGKLVSPGRAVFGLGGGFVRFVLAPKPAEPVTGALILETELDCGAQLPAKGLTVRVGDRLVVLKGEERLELSPGFYRVVVEPVPGAEIESETRVQVLAGKVSRVTIRVHPKVSLSLRLPTELRVGDTAPAFVVARTQYPGTIPVNVYLAASGSIQLLGATSYQGEVSASHPFEVRPQVQATQPGVGSLAAKLVPCGNEAKATVNVTVPPEPRAALEREIQYPVLLPGESTQICLVVHSTGDAPLTYQLIDEPPEWLEVEGPPRFEGTLAPGASRRHCYEGTALYGKPITSKIRARLASNAGVLENTGEIGRVLLGLSKVVDPPKIALGDQARFTIRLKNPLGRGVRVQLEDLPDPGLGLKTLNQVIELGPYEERVISIPVKPTRVGTLRNVAKVYVGKTPAAPAAEAFLVVEEPPRMARFSEVHIDFSVDYPEGDALLIRHAPPPGAVYRLGSSRLDGKPISDPRRDDEGRLYWKLPFREEGTLSYVLDHEGPIGPLPEPELTLLVADKEIPLQGNLRLADYERAKPVVARVLEGPRVRAVSDEQVVLRLKKPATIEQGGVPVAVLEEPGDVKLALRPGENRFTVRSEDVAEEVSIYRSGPPASVEWERVKAVADGRTPLVYRLIFKDASGWPAAVDEVTLEAIPEPTEPDADPMASGYQLAVRNGEAILKMKPMATPGYAVAKVLLEDGTVQELRDYVEGPDRTLYLAQGSVTARLFPKAEIGGLARGYVETPWNEGYLQAALDLAYAKGGLSTGLSNSENPSGRFPLTGSSKEATLPLVSDDGFAFRYDRQNFSVGYSRLPEGYSGLYVELRDRVRARAHVGLVPKTRVQDRIVPDGSRVYALAYPAKPGSETVYLEVGGVQRPLVRFRDYSLDALSGTLYLAFPLWPTDDAMNPQTLVVEYSPLNAPRNVLAFGVTTEYNEGPFSLGASIYSKDSGHSFNFGLEARYQIPGFGATFAYRNAAGSSSASVSADGRYDRYTVSANLTVAKRVAGRARIAAQLTDKDRAALEHEGNNKLNETRVLYERQFNDALSAGLGLGYRWETAALAGIGRVNYAGEDTRVAFTHSQPFHGAARSSLELTHRVDMNLSLRGSLAYLWGQGLEGYVGFDQKVGPANLALSYQLPGASGEGNRARFGVRAPFVIDEQWHLDVNAGVSYDFNRGEKLLGTGVSARYRTEELSAAFGVDTSFGDRGTKLVFRAGATGSLDARQVLSADATFQVVPEKRGSFTLAYAYRGEVWQALTYHRLRTHPLGQAEGELALSWHPNLRYQVRPSAAYRLFLANSMGNTFQVGLGANYYFTRRMGVGGGLYYVTQPKAGKGGFAFSVEGSYRVLDPVWVNVGYTFGHFTGVTPEASPGLYVRLDLFAGQTQ